MLEKDIFIIGGPEIIKQTFNLFKEFYLTRIYGNFNCDKFIDINKIRNSMKLIKKLIVMKLVTLKFGKNEKLFRCLKYCYENGDFVKSRAGNVKKAFGYQMRFNLEDGFPAVTTKKLAWKAVVSELLWFLEGSNDERRLAEILYDDKRENLEIKKLFGLKMLKQIIGKINQNLLVMLVKFMECNGEILMVLIK